MIDETDARALVLRSLLDGVALPGSEWPIVFPDLASYPDARPVLIGEPDAWREVDLPANIEFVPSAAASSLESAERPALIFEFLPAEPRPDGVGVRLRVSAVTADSEPLGLGEVVATFGPGEPARVVDGPFVVAY